MVKHEGWVRRYPAVRAFDLNSALRTFKGSGFRVQGAGSRVQGAWCMVFGAWCMVYGVAP